MDRVSIFVSSLMALISERILRRKQMKITKLTMMAPALLLACLSLTTTARADGTRSYLTLRQ